jgi:predicted NBD/HSP70 family sugar kinase
MSRPSDPEDPDASANQLDAPGAETNHGELDRWPGSTENARANRPGAADGTPAPTPGDKAADLASSGKVGHQSMRQVNRSVVLDLIRDIESISRPELARRSGLTKPTVAAIVEDLMREDIVRELGFTDSAGAGGRPARLLEFNADSAAYLGIEFGVEETSVAVADGRGAIRSVVTSPAVKNPDRALAALPELVAGALKTSRLPRARLQAVGACVPGLVDQTSGQCRLAPNLGWKDYPLRSELERALRRPVVVTNITQTAAIAEGRLGAARGVQAFIWLYLGSGVGAGIVLKGRPFTGTRGFAGEIGHCRISDKDVPCGCGKSGHLESFTSKMAVIEAAQRAAHEHPSSRLAQMAPIRELAPLFEAAREGDRVATAVLARLGDDIAKGVSYLVNVIDPQMIVLGGSVGTAGPALLEHVGKALARHALFPEPVRVVQSSLGDRAALIGAVLLAMQIAVPSYRLVAGGEGSETPTFGPFTPLSGT